MGESNQHSILVDVVRSKLDLIAGMDGLIAKQKFEELVEQLERATSEDFSLVPKNEYIAMRDRLERLEEQLEAQGNRVRDLRYALDNALAFINPEVAGDYHLWEALLRNSNPAIRPDKETS